MKMSFWGKRFFSSALLISLTWILALWLVDIGWTQDKSGEAVGTNAQAEEALDLLGDLPPNGGVRLASTASDGSAYHRSA